MMKGFDYVRTLYLAVYSILYNARVVIFPNLLEKCVECENNYWIFNYLWMIYCRFWIMATNEMCIC